MNKINQIKNNDENQNEDTNHENQNEEYYEDDEIKNEEIDNNNQNITTEEKEGNHDPVKDEAKSKLNENKNEKRVRKQTQRYKSGEYMTNDMPHKNAHLMIFTAQLISLDDEPITYENAINNKRKDKWINAIKSELNSLKENNMII